MYLLEFVGEDDALAVAEAGVAADIATTGPGVGVAADVNLERVPQLAFTRRCSRLVGITGASVAAAVRLVAHAPTPRYGGVGPERPTTDAQPPSVAVRARNIRSVADVSTREAEESVGTVLTNAGFSIDLESPDHVLCAVFSEDRCYLGWELVCGETDFEGRKPTDRPFFQPGSMDPRLARALCNLALPGAVEQRLLLDPMCGTGGLLLEGGLVGAQTVGLDVQPKMVRGARRNIRAVGVPGASSVAVGDARHLPIGGDSVDGVVVDLPYGRQSPIRSGSSDAVVPDVLAEMKRVLDGGRAVVVGHRDLRSAISSANCHLVTTLERRVHRSLTRYIHVVSSDPDESSGR